MSDFKKKIINEIVNPVQSKNRVYTLVATITGPKYIKIGGTYEIEFVNENGETQKKSGVKVRSYSNNSSGNYKPEIGDTVLVEAESNNYTIIGKCSTDEDMEKSELEKKADVYTNLIFDRYPGFLGI